LADEGHAFVTEAFFLTYISKVESLCRNQDICFFHFCHTGIDKQDAKTFLSFVKLFPALCYRNWDKLWPDEALGLYADLTFTYILAVAFEINASFL